MPTIILWVLVLVLGMATAALLYIKQSAIETMTCVTSFQELHEIGQNKQSLLFFMAQVISAYSRCLLDTMQAAACGAIILI